MAWVNEPIGRAGGDLVIKRSAKLFVLYLFGVVIVLGWSLGHVFQGTVNTENAAGVIVFPLAWVFGFWPTVVPLLLAHRIWRLQGTLEAFCERRALGLPTDAHQDELEDTLTLLAAEENGIPQRWVRPFVRRVLRRPQHPSSASSVME
jgi:hypothetical protein